MEIHLIRHGESEMNAGLVRRQDIGDHNIKLTPAGWEQARSIGRRLGEETLRTGLLYTSPYRRTREAMQGMVEGAGIETRGPLAPHIREDPRLREVERGYGEDLVQEAMRKVHGWFYYGFDGGESPADCFDRTSAFLESLMRRVQLKNPRSIVIATHGLTIRCFVMRFLYLRVEGFEVLANPQNCDVVTLGPAAEMQPQFTSGLWGVHGLRIAPQVGSNAK